MRLNLGCGPVQPEGWVNVDGSMRAKLASWAAPVDQLLTKLGVIPPTEFSRRTKVLNLLKPLPYRDATVDAIYAGELWEHLERDAASRLTEECFRVLRPGGVLRICVPDGEAFWRDFLAKLDEQLAKPAPQRDSQPLHDHVQMYYREICTRRRLLGSMGHFHKWQYDEVQLMALFSDAGFSDVQRRAFHDSRIEDIDQVERSDFLIVEGVRE